MLFAIETCETEGTQEERDERAATGKKEVLGKMETAPAKADRKRMKSSRMFGISQPANKTSFSEHNLMQSVEMSQTFLDCCKSLPKIAIKNQIVPSLDNNFILKYFSI